MQSIHGSNETDGLWFINTVIYSSTDNVDGIIMTLLHAGPHAVLVPR